MNAKEGTQNTEMRTLRMTEQRRKRAAPTEGEGTRKRKALKEGENKRENTEENIVRTRASGKRRQEPQPGDLIEIFRSVYQHWAIYVGDGYVVHIVTISDGSNSGPGSSKSVTSGRAVVKKQLLTEVVGNDKYSVNNIMDGQYNPCPVSEIVRSAKMQVGQMLSYSMTSKNCEHFVTELRYGRAKSQQVQTAKTWTVVGMAAAGIGGTLLTTRRRQQQ